MYKLGSTAKIITTMCFGAVCAIAAGAQSQPDSQAGAQLGEQSALAGKQAQGANTQKTTEKSPNEVTAFVTGTVIDAELTSPLDSKKVKPGDVVKARAASALKSADGRTILPKGTNIVGHVTQASARSAGQSDSSLGLVFDKAILKNGPEITLNAGVQAVGASPSSAFDTNQPSVAERPVGTMSGPGNGGQVNRGNGGVNSSPSATAPGGTDDPYGGANPPDASNSNGGRWDASTHGVVGLRNLNLNSAGDGKGSIITSNGKNVHLDSGTRLLLTTGAVGSQAAGLH